MPSFRQLWFRLFLQDEASFMQILGIGFLIQGRVVKALQYQQKALQSVNRRLSDPRKQISNGIMGAVMAYTVADVSLEY